MVRSSSFSRRLIAPVLVLGIAALAAPGSAGAVSTAKEVRSYWTPERMASAIPGDALLQDVAPVGDLVEGVGYGMSSESARRDKASRVPNPSRNPFRTHGKVFFNLGGLNYVCSGTSVKSKTKSLVVTAGHCTYSEMDGYASQFMFAPAYDNEATPFGEFTAKKIKATRQWERSEDIRYDVGMATVGKAKGKKLAKAVGSRGISFGKGRNQRFSAFGYPADDPFDGESMFRCNSKSEGTDRSQQNPEPSRIDCDMTGGSSGGGWVIDGGKVNSVVSYGYECGVGPVPIPIPCENPEEGKLFGPYFGGEIKKLYRSMR